MHLDACVSAPENWEKLPIHQVCERITSGGTPSRKRPEFYDNGTVNWVKTKELEDNYIHATEEKITSDAIMASSTKLLPKDTILLAMYGATVGMLGILSKEMACNQACCALILKPEFDRDFLFYQLLAHRSQLQSLATGAAQQNLSGQQIKELVLPFPSLGEQRAIGSYLRTLDDRITLLRETNATLEAIAQALFKSWFVDFDPVRAKMEGRAPEGMDEATAALFPDSFEESELGLVPKGWRVGSLGDVARLQKSSVNPLHQPGILFEHYSLPAFDNGQSPIIEAGIEIKSNKTLVPSDAVLLSKLNPHIPRVWLPADAGSNAVCSTEFLAFIPADAVSREFIYCIFSSERFLQTLCQLVTGTSNSHQRVKPDGVLSMSTVIPPADVMVSFASIAKPIFNRIGHNRQQVMTLANLRDTLLHRLISGQLRLPHDFLN